MIHLPLASIKISYTVQFSCISPLFCNWSTSTAKKYEIFFTCRVIFHRAPCKSFFSLTWNFIRLTFDTNMLLFFSACPDIVWMLFFLERKKKMRVQCRICVIIVAYTIISIHKGRRVSVREKKHCTMILICCASEICLYFASLNENEISMYNNVQKIATHISN